MRLEVYRLMRLKRLFVGFLASLFPCSSNAMHLLCWQVLNVSFNVLCNWFDSAILSPLAGINLTINNDYMRKLFKGTVASMAMQCDYPINGKTGTFLYTGESHKDSGAIVSPLFDSVYDLVQWTKSNEWTSFYDRYVFDGKTKDVDYETTLAPIVS